MTDGKRFTYITGHYKPIIHTKNVMRIVIHHENGIPKRIKMKSFLVYYEIVLVDIILIWPPMMRSNYRTRTPWRNTITGRDFALNRILSTGTIYPTIVVIVILSVPWWGISRLHKKKYIFVSTPEIMVGLPMMALIMGNDGNRRVKEGILYHSSIYYNDFRHHTSLTI